MAYELRDYFETSDGSRPETKGLAAELARGLSLPAFALLRSGDMFEHATPHVDAMARAVAANWVATLEVNGSAHDFVRSEMVAAGSGTRIMFSRASSVSFTFRQGVWRGPSSWDREAAFALRDLPASRDARALHATHVRVRYVDAAMQLSRRPR